MSARIERLAGFATLQSLPIFGYRRFGVPVGGAADQESFRLVQALLGNAEDLFAIELSNASIEVVFATTTMLAVCGAPARITAGDSLVVPDSSFLVKAGDRVTVSAPALGWTSYLGVAGGWLPEGIDTIQGRAGRRINTGDTFQHRETGGPVSTVRLADPSSKCMTTPFRYVRGLRSMIGALPDLSVSVQSDRTGIRLDGLPAQNLPELTSEPACPGTIQITPSGQLIVIGPDGPTIAGYPKIGVVCSADFDRLAQLRPGEQVELAEVEMDEAIRLRESRDRRLSQRVRQIEIARTRP